MQSQKKTRQEIKAPPKFVKTPNGIIFRFSIEECPKSSLSGFF
jgi:hypothetical protein